jgi:hypothetical protein
MVLDGQLKNTIPFETINLCDKVKPHSLTVLFAGLSQYWLNSSIQHEVEIKITHLYSMALQNGYPFFALIFAEILGKISQNSADYIPIIDRLRNETGMIPILPILEPEEPWKRSLHALIHATTLQQDPVQTVRLAWMIDFDKGNLEINPREQKLAPSGEWSKGRPLSLARLASPGNLSSLSIHDRKICVAIEKVLHPETHTVSYRLDMDRALVAMIGHPLLFLSASPTTPVEFIAGEPELLVEEYGNQLHIRFAQTITSDNVTVFQETPTRFKIITINDNHRRIAQITGKDGLTVPIEASDQVLTAIGNISSFMTVHSAIAADVSLSLIHI